VKVREKDMQRVATRITTIKLQMSLCETTQTYNSIPPFLMCDNYLFSGI
jgi:hypothetical protein